MNADQNLKEIQRRIRKLVAVHGSQVAVASALDFSPQYLSDIKHGLRDPSDAMLARLGLERVVKIRSLR